MASLTNRQASPACHNIEPVSQEGQTIPFSTARYQQEITGDSLTAAISAYQSAMMIDPTRGVPASCDLTFSMCYGYIGTVFNQMAALMGDNNHYIDAVYYYMRRCVAMVMAAMVDHYYLPVFHLLTHLLELRGISNRFMTRILKSFKHSLLKKKEGPVKME